jgi:A/G-specific adenine glycosylase
MTRSNSLAVSSLSASPEAAALLAWYDRHARVLPWRVQPGRKQRADPYRVWLSEVMLQQTTVAAVAPYYARFLERWPTIADLAAAPREDVLAAWAGLGYYARARKLHECAVVVARDFGGRFPETEAELLDLPGIGPYTAAAISAIAFGNKATVVDGNVERVIARVFAVRTPLPDSKGEIKALTASLVPERRAGDFAQAMMDLGATICTPKRPACVLCPWADECLARREGLTEVLPRRVEKGERPVRRGVAFFAQDDRGFILLRRRADKGLLGGMLEVQSTPWRADVWPRKSALEHAPFDAEWKKRVGQVGHTFTHFHLELDVFAATAPRAAALKGEWADPARIAELALPSVMKKVIALGLRLK